MQIRSGSIRQHADRNCKATEPLLSLALASGKCALWQWRSGASKVDISASYYRLLGYRAHESRARAQAGLIDHIHPDDRGEMERNLRQARTSNAGQINLKFRVVDHGGDVHWVAFRGESPDSIKGDSTKEDSIKGDSTKEDLAKAARAKKDRQPTMVGALAFISVYKQTEMTLAENERRLNALMNHLPGMVYRNAMVDGQWHSEFVSNGIKALLGYEKAYFMANRQEIYANAIQPRDRQRMWSAIERSMQKQQPYEVVYRIKTASGDYKWVWDKGEMLLAEDGSPLVMEGFMMDITTFKHEEIRLQASLHTASKERYRFGRIVGKSDAMQKVYEMITTAAASETNVIIYGESGTGKELVARAIQQAGKRSKAPFVVVNCGAIAEKLMESEFFGYKKGAFTGAQSDKQGFLAAVEGGTLFLDELGEISLDFQVKLLRVLDGHGYTPVGGNTTVKTDVRIIAATNRSLEALVQQGRMRRDFYYRIHIIPITVPPLKKRRKDIPLLIDHFLEKYQTEGTPIEVPADVRHAMQAYDWPGNVRELENVIQRYVVLGEVEPVLLENITAQQLQHPAEASLRSATGGLKSILANFEKQVLIAVLEKNKWRRDKTARQLKLTRRTLYRKMASHGIK